MKKQLIIGIALVAGLGTYGFFRNTAAAVSKVEVTEIHWYSLEEAQKLNAANPRKLFIDFTTSWCGWCKVMDANTFKNPTIAKYMSANYYCVKFDAETHDTVTFNGQKFWNRGAPGQRSANDFAITVMQGRLSYPTFAFVTKDQMSFTLMQGYQTPEQFEPYIHYYGEEKEKTMTYDAFLKIFKSELPKVDPAQQTPPPAPH